MWLMQSRAKSTNNPKVDEGSANSQVMTLSTREPPPPLCPLPLVPVFFTAARTNLLDVKPRDVFWCRDANEARIAAAVKRQRPRALKRLDEPAHHCTVETVFVAVSTNCCLLVCLLVCHWPCGSCFTFPHSRISTAHHLCSPTLPLHHATTPSTYAMVLFGPLSSSMRVELPYCPSNAATWPKRTTRRRS